MSLPSNGGSNLSFDHVFVYFGLGCYLHLDKHSTSQQHRIESTKFAASYALPAIMSYNPRMSMVPSSQQQNRGGGKKKEDDSDAFMRLVRTELVCRGAHANTSSPTKKLQDVSMTLVVILEYPFQLQTSRNRIPSKFK